MLRRGRVIILVAVLIAVITSSERATGYSRRIRTSGEPQVAVTATAKTVALRKVRGTIIEITNAHGRFNGGDNEFCVVFQKKETRQPVDVRNVSVDFVLLVGKIQEQPIKTQLVQDQPGHYCGHVNLGKQYYVPASYYAFIRYTDTDGKKRKERLFLAVK